ncbi:DCC1-like thiol-disulfide oxidoreductase family protein [Phycisphaeraceae bacterium D3-23]
MPDTTEYIFYDGQCGLCHRWVKRVLASRGAAERFVFSPLQGDFIGTRLSEDERAALPDSVVVQTHDGKVLTRSSAVLYVMRRLGGLRGVLAVVGHVVPRPLRDLVYVGVAKMRSRLSARPDTVCPMMPPEHRARFRS